jgi:hypothetical protein
MQRRQACLTGSVLASNQRMLDMCRALGFEIATDPEDISIRKVRLKLLTTPQSVSIQTEPLH